MKVVKKIMSVSTDYKYKQIESLEASVVVFSDNQLVFVRISKACGMGYP